MISDTKPHPWNAAALAMLLGTTPALGAQCLSADSVFKAGPKFSGYAAGLEKAARPAPVALASREARRFRSMLGMPGEDETRDGVRYLHWTGARFEQVKFVPAREMCRAD